MGICVSDDTNYSYKILQQGEIVSDQFSKEVAEGKRFEFGKNWKSFLLVLNDERIHEAGKSLTEMLAVSALTGKSFLDIGSGSGLFSLAAKRLGAKVYSFDYDPQSVACTSELKRRYSQEDRDWSVEEGSALDQNYLESLGKFDVVYSWGVLHHTGALWQALENALLPLASGGKIFVAIYNDQGWKSNFWRFIKRTYCSGRIGKSMVVSFFVPALIFYGLTSDLLRLKNPLKRYEEYKKLRGMSRVNDWFDWLGGYPFEVATPDEVFEFFKERGFVLVKLKTCGGTHSLNQFVFKKTEEECP